jgi:hypothetical protein
MEVEVKVEDEGKPKSRKKPDPVEAVTDTVTETAREAAAAAQDVYQPIYDQVNPRRSSAERPNSFNPVAWMVDGATGVVEEVKRSDLGLSQEFWTHFYAMRREGILAARAAVESVLSRIEKSSEELQEQIERQARRGEVKIKS